VRRRVVPVEGAAVLTSGVPVTAGEAEIGRVGSVAGTRALAMVRLDRVAEAVAKGVPVEAGGVAITVMKPAWATFELLPATATAPPAAGKP
jgi:folate-binding Fe-S cluster repair protein YgfZ